MATYLLMSFLSFPSTPDLDLEIAQPSFSGSVKGLSSYIAYPIPIPLEYTLEFSFKIIPTTLSQISLLAFIGQNGHHDDKSDHLAVSFIQGNVLFFLITLVVAAISVDLSLLNRLVVYTGWNLSIFQPQFIYSQVISC